jgi:pimeloyl-ACP methyl ester carboxylesterase
VVGASPSCPPPGGGRRPHPSGRGVLEEGEGPLVLLCHGFPETSWSWRHQLPILAGAGYRAVAPDLRGYGATRGPAHPEQCDVVSLTEDLVALVEALGGGPCHLVGHDFGALLSWHAAVLRPDVFRTVACLSVGFPSFLTGPRPPLDILAERMGEAFHYILYFQTPGPAEAELEADVEGALASIYWASSGEAPAEASTTFQPTPSGRTTLLGGTPSPPPGAMPWLAPEDLREYAAAFRERGFAGPLAWYRAMNLGWERLGEARTAKVAVPALYVVGTHDVVYRTTSGLLARMKEAVPNLDRIVTLEGCGHWTQQERPAEVGAALLNFLRAHD